MSRDLLLSDDWPNAWVPFSVEVRPDGTSLELLASGHLDRWTAGALLRNLIAVCEPSFTEVHLDLRQCQGAEEAGEVLERCRAFADARGLRFHVSTEPTPWMRNEEWPVALPTAAS